MINFEPASRLPGADWIEETSFIIHHLSFIIRTEGPEGEVHSRLTHFLCRRQAMEPVGLGGTFHFQEAAVFQEEGDGAEVGAGFVFEGELALGPELMEAMEVFLHITFSSSLCQPMPSSPVW